MHSFTELIDGNKANQYLVGAQTKRSQSVNVVQQYLGDMLAGRWGTSHQGLLFGPPEQPELDRGALRDGGHRMLALAEASKMRPDIAFQFQVTVEDFPGEVPFGSIDAGRGRTLANLLQIDGHQHYVQLGAITRRVLLWEAARPITRSWNPSKLETVARADAEPELETVDALYAHSWTGRALGQMLPPGCVGFCHWLFRHIDSDDAKQFMYQLREGVDLAYQSPVHTLRERLRSGELSWAKRYPGREPEVRIALTIMAWNKYRGGVERVTKYQLPNPLTDETFPRPV